jgi:hypothetical protein
MTIAGTDLTFTPSSLDLIQNNSKSSSTFQFTIPSSSLPGNITKSFTIAGTFSNGTSFNQPGSINITVNPVSALSLSKIRDLTSTQTGLINVTNTGNTALTGISLVSASTADFSITYNKTFPFTLNAGQSEVIELNSSNINALDLGDDTSLSIKATSAAANSSTLDIVVPLGFCDAGNIGDLDITDFSIENLGEGDDEEWNAFDEIEMEIEVSNEGDDDLSSVYVELMIIDSEGNDVTDDFNLENDKIKISKIRDDSEESVVFRVTEVPADLDEGDYTIYAKAYKSGNENTQCFSESQTFELKKEFDRAVIVRESELNEIQLSCGQTNELSFNVYNAGNDDEDSVLVVLENAELKIRKTYVLNDLRDGEKELVSFNVFLPNNLNKTRYNFVVYTYFDYDDGDTEEEFSYDQNSADDLDEDFVIPARISNCIGSSSIAVSAVLASDAKVGENMVVQVGITNTGASGAFTLSPSEYSAWANLVSVEPQQVNVSQGTSKQVLVTLKPTKAGSQSFNVQITGPNGQITTQQIQVDVAGTSGIFSQFGDLGSTQIFLIAAIILVLILVVIVLIIKFSKRKTAE